MKKYHKNQLQITVYLKSVTNHQHKITVAIYV